MEEFKKIKNYENYEISNFGNVKNSKTSRILKTQIKDGYKQVTLNNKTFRINRLVGIAFIENPLNKECVDHIDGNRANNNVSNLRWATKQENSRNSNIYKNNTTGIKGVCKMSENKYYATITINNKQLYLGTFKTLEEAKEARQKKANEIFGEFTNSIEKIKHQLNNALSELEQLEIEFNKI